MDEKKAFDWKLFGAALKDARKEAGYRGIPAFSNAIKEIAELSISEVTLYKIETGRQQPRVSELMAFSLTLFGATNALEMDNLLQGCICEEWRIKNKDHLDDAMKQTRAEAAKEQVGMSLAMMRINQAEAVFKKKLALATKAFDSVALVDSSTTEQINNALAIFEESSKKALEAYEKAIQGAI